MRRRGDFMMLVPLEVGSCAALLMQYLEITSIIARLQWMNRMRYTLIMGKHASYSMVAGG